MTAYARKEWTDDGFASGHVGRLDGEDLDPMRKPRRVLGYARVSSAEQALGSSLSDQQESIRRYAASRGLTVSRFYVEAESAIQEKIERREQIRALLNDVRAGDLVVVDKLDRWSRDPAFTHTSVKRLLDTGVSFYAVADRCDPSTSEGDTMLGFRVLFAREEHKRIRERMVGTRELLRDRGYYVSGTPPLGYRRGERDRDNRLARNVLLVVPEQAEIVRRIFRLYIAGRSMTKVAEHLGLKLDRVKDALHNRTYLGEQKNSRGEWIRGKHEPIVEPDVFVRAQALIAERRLGGPRPRDAVSETSTWLLRDVARCLHCGAKMGASYAGPKGDGRRHYYYCTKRCQTLGYRANTRAFVPVREVEATVGPLVLARLEELRERIARGPERAPAVPTKNDLAERRAKLARRRERVLAAFEDEAIDREEMRAKMARLDAERTKLDAEEAEAKRPDALADRTVRRSVLRELDAVRRAWRNATPSERRAIVGLLASAVRIAKGREPEPVWRTAEELAADVRP